VSPAFEQSARLALEDSQLRRNLGYATQTIRQKRAQVVGELADWQALREAGSQAKQRVLDNLDDYLLQLESAVQHAGGHVHWARNSTDANQIVGNLASAAGAQEVVKVKSITTDEIGLNEALKTRGIEAIETDLAELIVALAGEKPSHILVPAIHKNRAEIRDVLSRGLGLEQLSDDPRELCQAARLYLRSKFLHARVGVSGANFAVAQTGTVVVVESEGNGRMCTTLPEVLITVMGIDKVIATWQDLEVFLQLLPRSSTAERMNPYTSLWTGTRAGDGPGEFHLVLLDNGRANMLADHIGSQALRCIRCSACLNVCPVYTRTGGHAYGSVYPGPIGAILTPQLQGLDRAGSLPYASSLCGACYEVCPVKIDIPSVLLHLRNAEVSTRPVTDPEKLSMRMLGRCFTDRRLYERAQKLSRIAQKPVERGGRIRHLPAKLSGWTEMRDMPAVPKQTFREWWRKRGARTGADAGT
jgi:L-lactate dehydrogenase complex protein LldF